MKDEEIGNKIGAWRNLVGLEYISRPEDSPIKAAMTLTGVQVRHMNIDELGEHLVVLDSYYTYLSAHMGQIYSRVQWNGDVYERAKLNQIKPLTDALKVKIDLYKKIYDRKVREAKWRAYNATSDRS